MRWEISGHNSVEAYGSGGDEIALRVAERLGYDHVNKELISEVAKAVIGMGKEAAKLVRERKKSG